MVVLESSLRFRYHGKAPVMMKSVWLQVLAIYGAAAVFVFGLFALVEHVAGRFGISPGTAALLHAVRGLLCSFVVALAVAYHLLKRIRYPNAQEPTVPFPEAEKLRWFVSLRWIALAVVVVGSASFALFDLFPHHLVIWLGGWSALLAATNIIWAVRVRRTSVPAFDMGIQVAGDLLLLTLLLALTGGISNPLASLYIIHVVLSAVLLGTHAAFLTSVASTVLLVSLAFAELGGFLPGPPESLSRFFSRASAGEAVALVITQVVLMFVLAYLTGLFARALREQAKQNAELAARLSQEHARLEATLEQMIEGVMFVDGQGRPLLVNSAMKRLWGTSFANGEGILTCHPPHARTTVENILNDLSTGTSPRFHRSTQRNGRHLETTLAPVHANGSPANGLVIVTRDVTDQRQMQDQMIRQEKLSVLGRLASSVAHELNNPLAAIATFADLIVQHPCPCPEISEHANTILRNIHSCKRIVQDLLGYAAPAQPHRTVMDLTEALRETDSLLKPLIKKHRLELSLPKETAPLLVTADAGQVRQAFTNLIMNAVKAVEQAAERRISVTLEARGRMASICVQDTGAGIPPEHQGRLFEPFFTTRPDGTGLGLAIVKGIAERHGGKVWFDSPPGKGASFFLELPLYEPSVSH